MSPFVSKIIEHKEGMKTASERVELLQKTITYHQRSIDVLGQDLNDDEKNELAEWEKANKPPAPAAKTSAQADKG